mgnify:CR=1 FL=1
MKAFKHMTALVLALVMAAALAVTAYAASVTVKYRVYVYSDEITFRQYDYSQSTTPSITNLTISATSSLGSGSALYHMKYADGAVAYCIEPGVHSDDSGTYKEGSSASWYNLPAAVQSGIALAMSLGYPSADYGAASSDRNSSAIINAEKWAATQTIELKRNAAGSYTATVTDTNGVLSAYNFAANSGSGITFTRKGDTLTITATAAAAKNLDTEKIYSATGSAYEIDPDRAVICWYDRTGRYQAMAGYTGVGRDPVKAYIKIKAVEEKGSITVRKVVATGAPLAGAELLLETSADGKTWTEVGRVTTDSTGAAKWEELTLGAKYRITEVKAPAGYTLLTEPLFAGVGQQADDHIDPDLRLGFGKFRVGGVLVILLQRLQVLPLDVVDLDGRIPVDQVADHDVELFQRHRIEVCPLFQRLPLHGRGDDGTHGGNDDDHGQIK